MIAFFRSGCVVKTLLGMTGFVLAGCVAQPPKPLPAPQLVETTVLAAPMSMVLRVGIEHLPPESAADDRQPQVEPATRRGSTGAPATATAPQDPSRRPESSAQAAMRAVLQSQEQAATQDPLERHTLLFLRDLLDADSRRVRRQAGLPFFASVPTASDTLYLLPGERELLQAQQQWTSENGPQLFQRPLEQLARRLPLVREIELDWRSAREDLMPLAADRTATARSSDSLGHLSMRLRANNLQDPVELVYVIGGLRAGSSQTTGKLSLELPLADGLLFEVHARTVYATGAHTLRADLTYRYSEHTTFHAAIGDNMAFVANTGPYALFDSTMAGEAGLVLYAVHRF